MKFDDKKSDPNAVLIPRDMIERRRFSSPSPARSGTPTKSGLDGQSCLADACKAVEEDTKKTAPEKEGSSAGQGAGDTGPSADEVQASAIKKAQEKAKEEQEAGAFRARAREFQTQMKWWESKRGTGEYDNNKIDGMITQIKSQLGGIPSQFWY